MSGYATGEALIQTLVAAVTGFGTNAVSRGNWKVLNTGRSDTYAVLLSKPNEPREFTSPVTVVESWITTVQVWQRYRDDGTTYTNLAAAVEAVLAKLDTYPHLNDQSGYVEESNAAVDGEVLEMWRKGGGPAWLRQDIAVIWTGRQTITFVSGG